MANSTAVMAGGHRMVLVGREAEGATPVATVAAKFQNAMVAARQKVATAVALVSAGIVNLSAQQESVLRFCFNPTNQQRAETFRVIKEKLSATVTGLQTEGLEVCDPDPEDIPAQAEGYVPVFLGFKGAIYTKFNLSDARTAFNLVHEATHKFADTVDAQRGYISANFAGYMATRVLVATVPGFVDNIRLLDNNVALTNADSFAQFAMGV
jgi:hypothetical protein